MGDLKEHPILFSGEMVRAILDGRKTMTRRVIVPPHACRKYEKDHRSYPAEKWWVGKHPGGGFWAVDWPKGPGRHVPHTDSEGFRCPYGVPGDRLWVRETWGFRGTHWTMGKEDMTAYVHFKADDSRRSVTMPSTTQREWQPKMREPAPELDQYGQNDHWRQEWARWRPSIHMPRWASRINLEVTGVRVERLQEIRPEDAIREGYPFDAPKAIGPETYLDWFRQLWNSINAKRGHPWDANDWVWAITFKKV